MADLCQSDLDNPGARTTVFLRSFVPRFHQMLSVAAGRESSFDSISRKLFERFANTW
jgi:hypothetical protein